MSGFFHAQCGSDDAIMAFLDAADDCPVMSGFFHARLEAEDAENALQDTYVIARLCRAFFMHNTF